MKLLLLCLLPTLAFCNACVATGTGNWTTAGTWSSCGGTFPGSSDTATIGAGITITIPSGARSAFLVTCNGTSGSPVVIQSAIGQNGWFTSTDFNCTYTTFLRIGDTSNNGITRTIPASTVETFSHVHFDTCGQSFLSASAASAGWSITNSTWIRSNAGVNGAYGHNNVLEVVGTTSSPSAARLIQDSVFDGPPLIYADWSSMIGNLFYGDYDSIFSSNQWAAFSGNLIRRLDAYAATGANGPMSGNYMILDHAAASYTGTAAISTNSSASGTLTVSGTPWTTNAYQTSGSPGHAAGDWMVMITGGTGANQIHNIYSNTTNTLTVVYPWDTPPDNTSTFSIFQGQGNPHWFSPASGVGNVTYSGNVIESFGTDNNGDIFEIGQLGTTTVSYNLELPNAALDNSGTLHTIFGFNNALTYVVEHNTYFTGAQSAAVAEGGNMVANQVTSFRSNLAWAYPARTAIYLVTGSSLSPSGLGPYVVDDSSHAGSCTGTTDIITSGAADYNGRYGLKSSPCGSNSYDLNVSVTPGTHDVVANPQFVDPTRNFASWASSLGSTGSIYAQQVDGLSQILLMNDSGYNASYSIAALISWVKAGFAPTNIAFHSTAADGTDIGAIAGVFNIPATARNGQISASGAIRTQ